MLSTKLLPIFAGEDHACLGTSNVIIIRLNNEMRHAKGCFLLEDGVC